MATKGYNLEQTGEQVQAALNKAINLGPATEEADGLMTATDKASLEHLNSVIDTKVDKVTGKGLSTNDFTNEDKDKLDTAYQVPSTGIPAADMSSGVQTSLNKANTSVQPADLVPITEKIPAQASAQNQLADKAFVNSSISTASADFKGTYDSLAELQAVTADKNDYGYVVSTDEAGNTVYSRYKCNGSSWVFEYDLNNSSFTAAEWAAIQSGITAPLVQKLGALPTNADLQSALSGKQATLVSGTNIKTVDGQSILGSGNLSVSDPNAVKVTAQTWTDAQKTQARTNIGAYAKPSGGIPKTDLDSGVQGSLDLADSAIQARPSGEVDPTITPAEYATQEELAQLEAEVNGNPAAWGTYETNNLHRSSSSPYKWVSAEGYTLVMIPVSQGDIINVTWKGTDAGDKGRRLLVEDKPVNNGDCNNLLDALSNSTVSETITVSVDGWFCINSIFNTMDVAPVAFSINGVNQFAPTPGLLQEVTAMGTELNAINGRVVDLEETIPTKLDKVIGTNLVDASKAELGKVIFYDGDIGDSASPSWCVSDYIRVDGKNIKSNASTDSSSIGSYNVYDIDKALLRTIVQDTQYTYQEGDYYVRISFKVASTAMANYGTTLAPYEPYTDYKPVADLSKQVTSMSGLAEQVPNKLDKIFGTNIVNPDDVITGAALSWGSSDGEPSTGLASNYVVSGFIPVDGKNIISNAWSTNNAWSTMFIYGPNKNFLRNNGTNQQYTYQEGDAYVRISWKSSSVSNWKANYGTALADYAPYTDYKPLQDLDVRVTAIEDKIGTVDYDYTTVALFKSLAVVGDSYSSGAIYGVSGAVEGRHDGMAWLNIMARRNGIQSTGLYATPSQNTTKFLDPTDSRYNSYGLGALLSDTAKDLYFIMLGINAEPDGVGVGTVEDCNVDWTQNATSFCGNIGKIIGNIKTHAPKAKIVCIVANMLFSNLNPATNSEKRAAIIAAAEFYGVAWMEAADNPFFSSTFYVSQLHTNHPVGTTYAGMAVAFEKLLSACIQANPTYFVDYVND